MTDQAIVPPSQSAHTADHDAALDHGASDRTYVVVAIFLAGMTALEVAVSYTKDSLGKFEDPLLLGLMAVKFFCVCLYFMHLKYDPKMAKRVFFSGLGIATIVYIMMLGTFRYWAHGFR